MSRLFRFCFCFIIISNLFESKGQAVKFIKNEVTAKYKVYITKDSNEANLFVFKVNKYEDAIGAGLWFIVDNPTLFKNAMTLFEIKNKDQADLVIYYTKNKKSAGYRKKK